MIGLSINNNLILRAYSISSSNYEKYLEFFSIKIKNGVLTSILKNIKINDEIFISKKSTGTLILNNLKVNGEILWLFSSGTGISPFISLLKDFNIKNFNLIIIFHSVKFKDSLCYKFHLLKNFLNKSHNKLFLKNLIYYPILSKEFFKNKGRITDLIINLKIFKDLNFKNFFYKRDRVMICGSMNMIKDIILLLKKNYLNETKNKILGEYLIEKSFVN